MPGPQRESFKPILLPTIEPRCPAGERVGMAATGSGCRCRIEDHVLTTGAEPTALAAYCYGSYTDCPTWQRDKEHLWIEKSNRALLGRDGDYRTGHAEDQPEPQDAAWY